MNPQPPVPTAPTTTAPTAAEPSPPQPPQPSPSPSPSPPPQSQPSPSPSPSSSSLPPSSSSTPPNPNPSCVQMPTTTSKPLAPSPAAPQPRHTPPSFSRNPPPQPPEQHQPHSLTSRHSLHLPLPLLLLLRNPLPFRPFLPLRVAEWRSVCPSTTRALTLRHFPLPLVSISVVWTEPELASENLPPIMHLLSCLKCLGETTNATNGNVGFAWIWITNAARWDTCTSTETCSIISQTTAPCTEQSNYCFAKLPRAWTNKNLISGNTCNTISKCTSKYAVT